MVQEWNHGPLLYNIHFPLWPRMTCLWKSGDEHSWEYKYNSFHVPWLPELHQRGSYEEFIGFLWEERGVSLRSRVVVVKEESQTEITSSGGTMRSNPGRLTNYSYCSSGSSQEQDSWNPVNVDGSLIGAHVMTFICYNSMISSVNKNVYLSYLRHPLKFYNINFMEKFQQNYISFPPLR